MASCSRGGGGGSSAVDGDRSHQAQGQEGSGSSRGTGTDEEQEDEEINWYSSPFYSGNFFSKLKDNDSAKCNSCPANAPPIKTKDGNTSGLDNHLKRKHSKIYEKFLAKKVEVEEKRRELKGLKRKVSQDIVQSKQTKLSVNRGVLSMKPPPPNPQVQKEFLDALINLCVECGISFSALSGPAFNKVVNVLNKHSREKVKVPSRYTLGTHVTRAADEVLKVVCAIIQTCRAELEGISFTTDIWTSINMESFISLTVHFIDKDWKFHRWTPYVKHFPDRHTGAKIKLILDEMIGSLLPATVRRDGNQAHGVGVRHVPREQVVLGPNVVQGEAQGGGARYVSHVERGGVCSVSQDIVKYVVNDNDASAKLAIKLSPDLNQILCAIHTLQLGIGDAFKDVSIGSAAMTKVLQKGKTLANTVKRSGPLAQDLKGACVAIKIPYTSLKNPNDTRWNSEVKNLESIIKLKKALVWLVNNADTTAQWSAMVFSPAEWRLAEAAVTILRIPLKVTKMWEGEVYPTMNLVVSELFEMKEKLKSQVAAHCIFTSHFAEVLLKKIERRFPHCASSDIIPAMANYLDPAFKGVHIENLGMMELTRNEILRRWDYLDKQTDGVENEAVEAVDVDEEDNEVNPTRKLLNARKALSEASDQGTSLLKKEMMFYENSSGIKELKPDGDRLVWWKENEQFLPLLSKVAKQVLGIPCSSAKSERVFSTGTMMVTKRRNRLGATRIENLLVIKENAKLIEEFKASTDRVINTNDDAFKAVVIETDNSQVAPPPTSMIFDDDEDLTNQEIIEDSTDDEFDVVFDSIVI